jgi:hypothetical protein
MGLLENFAQEYRFLMAWRAWPERLGSISGEICIPIAFLAHQRLVH